MSPSRERSGVIFFFRPVNRKDIKVPFGKVACSVLQRGCNSPPSQPLPVLLVFISRRKNKWPRPRETHLRGSNCEGHDSGHLEARRSQRKGRAMRNTSYGPGSEESADSPLSPNPSVFCQHREAPMLEAGSLAFCLLEGNLPRMSLLPSFKAMESGAQRGFQG